MIFDVLWYCYALLYAKNRLIASTHPPEYFISQTGTHQPEASAVAKFPR